MTITTTSNSSSVHEATPEFHVFLESRQPALAVTIAKEFGAISPMFRHMPEEQLRQRVHSHIDAYLRGLVDQSTVAPHVIAELGPVIRQHMEINSLLTLLSIFRQHFVRLSLEALAQGIPGAGAGLEGLMAITDIAAFTIAEVYHSLLNEGMVRQSDELRATRDRLDQAFFTSPLATIEWDTKGIVRSWNPSAERIFGWPADEAIGQNIVTLLVPDMALEHVQGVVDALLSGAIVNSRNLNITKDKRLITCQWYNTLVRDELGTVVGAISQTEDVSEQLRAEEERQSLQQQVIEAQAAALRELSTPLIPLANGIVAMPLIGSVDSGRAQQVIEELLSGVSSNDAHTAILDITGVPIVDTQVADALLRAAQAVKLLGAEVILTGIRPEVAQTLVGLGVSFNSLVTRSTLQSGIAYAFERGKSSR